jgi:lipopolysaccharide export system permease protein
MVQGNFKASGNDSQKVLIEGKLGDWVEGFHFYQIPGGDGGARTYVHAERAALTVDQAKSQLRIKLENAFFETRKPDGTVEMAFAGHAEPLLIDLKDPRSRRKRASAMSNEEIRELIANDPELTPERKVRLRLEITKRYTFSMACLAFAFIAVPLGLNSRRRDSSGGLILSLLIGTAYFLVTMMAEQFKSDAGATACLWAPNVVCVLLGLFLFRRARFK